MKSQAILLVVLLMCILLVSVEANKNHRNSTKWKEYRNRHNFGILLEEFDKKAYEVFPLNY
jgi:hypothetical protein